MTLLPITTQSQKGGIAGIFGELQNKILKHVQMKNILTKKGVLVYKAYLVYASM